MHLRWTLCVLALTVCGCTPGPPPPSSVPATPLSATYPAPEPADPPAVAENPVGDLALGDALVLALATGPGLAAEAREIRAREAEAMQADVGPNPEFGVEFENFAGSGDLGGVESLETTLLLSQLVELGGKRARRAETALFERDLGAWDLEARRIETLNRTTWAFLEVLAAQELVGQAAAMLDLTRDTAEAVRARVQAGGASPVEASRAIVAVHTAEIDLELAEEDLSLARAMLATHWGAPGPRFTRAVGDFHGLGPEPPPLDSLVARIDGNPDLARWATEIELRRARIASSSATATPDLTLAAGARHEAATGDLGMVFAVSAPLALFDRGQGRTRAAEERLAAAHALRSAARLAVVRNVMRERSALVRAHHEVTALQESALPEAEEALGLARMAYEQGRARLSDVFDAQRTLFELRMRHTHGLTRYHGAVANLESLIGESLGGH